MKKKIKSTTLHRFDTKISGSSGNKTESKGHKYSYSTFNEAGKTLLEIRYNEDGEVEEKFVNKYDAEGRLTEEITYLSDEEMAEHKSYERNEQGKIIRAYKHYQDGDKDTIHYKRDDDGKLIEKNTIDSYDEEEAREIIEYVNDKVKQRKVYEYDELMLDESYSYDDEGNITEFSKWTIEDENSKFFNLFDKKGNLVKAMKHNLKDEMISKAEYIYSVDKLVKITEENQYEKNTTTLTYDEHGNPLEQIELNREGEINNQIIRIYNDNHDISESEVFINFHGKGINQHYVLKHENEYFD